MSHCTVFYSWQSDLPNAVNRGFIQQALERATRTLRADASVAVEPVVERDTSGVAGAPDISATIFEKIDRADVFVADVSIVNSQAGERRRTPNPNVMIELGYAAKSLGWSRVLLVMNGAYGSHETLPFDLKQRRVIAYQASDGENVDRASERKRLEQRLTTELGEILGKIERSVSMQVPSLYEQATAAVKEQAPRQISPVRKYMVELAGQLQNLAPDLGPHGSDDEALVRSLDTAVPLVHQYARLTELAVDLNTDDAVTALYMGLEHVLAKYNLPRVFNGRFFRTDFDFYKFIGHELLTNLVGFLLREARWELLTNLLSRRLLVPPGTQVEPFGYVSQPVELLRYRNQRLKLKKTSCHGHLLSERYSKEPLSGITSFEQFRSADLFLYLRSVLPTPEPNTDQPWIPWTAPYLEGECPRFLLEARYARGAQELLQPLGVDSIETLRARLPGARKYCQKIFDSWVGPFADFDPATIGSQ